MIKLAVLLLGFLLTILSCSGTVSESQVSRNTPKSTPSPTPTDQETKLKTEEQLLKGEKHHYHDGALTLEYLGDIESVPALLKVLQEYPPSPNGTMACTTEHAVDALKKITGANPGYTHEKWKSWWDQYQKNRRREFTKRK